MLKEAKVCSLWQAKYAISCPLQIMRNKPLPARKTAAFKNQSLPPELGRPDRGMVLT